MRGASLVGDVSDRYPERYVSQTGRATCIKEGLSRPAIDTNELPAAGTLAALAAALANHCASANHGRRSRAVRHICFSTTSRPCSSLLHPWCSLLQLHGGIRGCDTQGVRQGVRQG